MRLGTFLASTAAASVLLASQALADAPKVIASIKPIHSLVSQVMQGIGEPGIIVDGAGSPHTYTLRPSQAAELEQADVIFWVGGDLEPFLVKPVETLGAKAKVVELAKAHGVTLLPYREGGPFEADVHDDHSDRHEDDGHAEAEADHVHEDGGHHEEAHSGEDHRHSEAEHDHEAEGAHGETHHASEADHHGGGHAHSDVDMHLWLDTQNAKALLTEIEEVLSEADPENAERYATNAKTAAAELDALQAEIEAEIAPVKGQPYIVFHDAYQYFEHRFGIPAAGSITVSPEVAPGAQRVTEIREKVERLGAVCVFAEPQFEPRIIETVIDGTKARSAVLDPEGAEIPNGPGLYPTLLRNIASSLRSCLSGAS